MSQTQRSLQQSISHRGYITSTIASLSGLLCLTAGIGLFVTAICPPAGIALMIIGVACIGMAVWQIHEEHRTHNTQNKTIDEHQTDKPDCSGTQDQQQPRNTEAISTIQNQLDNNRTLYQRCADQLVQHYQRNGGHRDLPRTLQQDIKQIITIEGIDKIIHTQQIKTITKMTEDSAVYWALVLFELDYYIPESCWIKAYAQYPNNTHRTEQKKHQMMQQKSSAVYGPWRQHPSPYSGPKTLGIHEERLYDRTESTGKSSIESEDLSSLCNNKRGGKKHVRFAESGNSRFIYAPENQNRDTTMKRDSDHQTKTKRSQSILNDPNLCGLITRITNMLKNIQQSITLLDNQEVSEEEKNEHKENIHMHIQSCRKDIQSVATHPLKNYTHEEIRPLVVQHSTFEEQLMALIASIK